MDIQCIKMYYLCTMEHGGNEANRSKVFVYYK